MIEGGEPSSAGPGPAGVRWEAVVGALEDGVVLLGAGGRVLAVNPAAERLLGVEAAEVTGRRPEDLALRLFDEAGRPLAVAEALAETTRDARRPEHRVVGVEPPGGGRRWLSTSVTAPAQGRAVAAVVVLVDVTERRRREAALRALADTDDLTALLNRRGLVAALERHLRSRRADDRGGALLLWDLDRFKEVNDAFGHAVGDRVLRGVADAARERLRDGDALARLGGDEFAVLLPRVDAGGARRVAEDLVARLARERAPTADGTVRPLAASVGIALIEEGADAEQMLARADAAMYAAKRAGRGTWRLADGTACQPGPARAPADGAGLDRRDRELTLVNALGARLADMEDAGAIADATVDELHRALGYHLCAVIQLRPDAHVQAIAVRGARFKALALASWSQPAEQGLIGRCLRERVPVLVNDIVAEPGYQVTAETTDVRSELVVPLLVEGAVWGAINVEELEPGAFEQADVLVLGTLANQVAAALRAARLLERLRQRDRAGG